MKINLHTHTLDSDGKDCVAVMMMEAKKIGLSASVITDHVYPNQPSRSVNIQQQRVVGNNVSKYLDFPFIQGIELNLGDEEILLFGIDVIREVLDYCSDGHFQTRADYTELIEFIAERKNRCACILCHPSLYCLKTSTKYYDALFSILDGYERINHGHDWFANRAVPEQLSNLKAFDNSDAHCYKDLALGNGNIHTKPITNEAELIKFIKGRRN